MSDYGIELINDYGLKVADTEDINYVLRSAGQFSNSNFYSYANSTSSISLMTTGMNCPLLFMKMNSSNARLTQKPGVNKLSPDYINPGTTIAQTSIDVFKWWNLDIGTIQYYIFDKWTPPERSDYGLQLFDRSGNIIFDAAWHFLRLRDVKWLDPTYPNHTSHESGSNWENVGLVTSDVSNSALSMPVGRGWTESSMQGGYYYHECCHLDSAGNLYISIIPTGIYLDLAPSGGWAGSMRTQVMIADTTGLPVSYNPVEIRRDNR
ncbi:hypothetical protein K5Y94_005157 [Escherichia coli]|nr:hypothetical protein [Escherichia coli]EIP7908478.1 hypothetical protein [Escherichia coli]